MRSLLCLALLWGGGCIWVALALRLAPSVSLPQRQYPRASDVYEDWRPISNTVPWDHQQVSNYVKRRAVK